MDTAAGHSAATDIYSACWRVVRMDGCVSACASAPYRVLACAVGGRNEIHYLLCLQRERHTGLVRGRLDLSSAKV